MAKRVMPVLKFEGEIRVRVTCVEGAWAKQAKEAMDLLAGQICMIGFPPVVKHVDASVVKVRNLGSGAGTCADKTRNKPRPAGGNGSEARQWEPDETV